MDARGGAENRVVLKKALQRWSNCPHAATARKQAPTYGRSLSIEMMRSADLQRVIAPASQAKRGKLSSARAKTDGALAARRTSDRQLLRAVHVQTFASIGAHRGRSSLRATAEASTSDASGIGQQPCKAAFLALACMHKFRRALVGTPEVLEQQHAGAVGGRRLPLALGGFVMCVPHRSVDDDARPSSSRAAPLRLVG